MKTTCKKPWPVNFTSDNILWTLYTSLETDIVSKIFPNLNVVAHLVIPANCRCLAAEAAYFSF